MYDKVTYALVKECRLQTNFKHNTLSQNITQCTKKQIKQKKTKGNNHKMKL